MNKTALVTGGSRNIGQGIAIVLAKHGYDVAITYNTGLEGALKTKQEIEALGRKCFVYQADLIEADAPQKVVDLAHKDLGRLDLMVCNAAFGGIRGSILTVTPEELDWGYHLTFRNYLLCAGAAARHMVADEIRGNIIFITSTRGESAHPDDYLYGGLKAGIKRATESIALDLAAYGIRVNCVAPGCIWGPGADDGPWSDFVKGSIPLKRVGTAAEIGELVAFVASEHGSYLTGITIRQDGGLVLPGLLENKERIPWVNDEWQKQQYEAAMKMMREQEEK